MSQNSKRQSLRLGNLVQSIFKCKPFSRLPSRSPNAPSHAISTAAPNKQPLVAEPHLAADPQLEPISEVHDQPVDWSRVYFYYSDRPQLRLELQL
jgi:hypothetical protein